MFITKFHGKIIIKQREIWANILKSPLWSLTVHFLQKFRFWWTFWTKLYQRLPTVEKGVENNSEVRLSFECTVGFRSWAVQDMVWYVSCMVEQARKTPVITGKLFTALSLAPPPLACTVFCPTLVVVSYTIVNCTFQQWAFIPAH